MSREMVNYRNNPKYWDRQAYANSVDPDQTPQNAASDRVCTVCHSSSNILDATGSKIDFLKCQDKYSKKSRCPNT